MKSQFLLFLFLIISNVIYSQKMNFNDLKYIYENRIETVDTYLLNKGFDFYGRVNLENEECPENRYAGKNQTFIVKICDEPKEGMTWYQLNDLNIYNLIREECKKNGYKFLRTRTQKREGDSLDYEYTNGKTKITFSSSFKQNHTKYFINYSKVYPHEL